MTVRETAKYVGFPSNCILRRFIRVGLLPWPDKRHSFLTEDVEALKLWLDAKRIGDTSVPKPDHRNT